MEHIAIEAHGASPLCEVQLRSDIGGREDQQDHAYVYSDENVTFAIVCDGMGGTEHGALASRIASESMQAMLKDYLTQQPMGDPVQFMLESMVELDIRVSRELGRQKGGTTAVAALVQDGKLYWFSAGDSRLYIIRRGEMVQATRDHNYFLRLNEQLQNGEITQAQYKEQSPRGEALISFLGVGGLPVYDLTNTPFLLREGDILLLTTDGLYKAIPQELIQHILRSADSLTKKADDLMAQISVLKKTVILDNTTYALIKIDAGGNPE